MVNANCDECKTGKLRQIIEPYKTKYTDAQGEARDLTVDRVTSYRCDNCDNEILDDSAMQQIEDARRNALGLLSATEICQLRRDLRKTQREMSELLGIGEKTYCRWETGSFQTEAFDRYLRLIKREQQQVVAWLAEIAEAKRSQSASSPQTRSVDQFHYLSEKRVASLSDTAARFEFELVTGGLFAH